MTTIRSFSPEAPRFKSTTSAASNYADFVSIPQFGVTRGILNEYIARDDLEKERAKKEEERQYQRSRDALVDSRYEADRKERLDDKFDAKQRASMTNEALALIGNKDAFLSGKISAENKAYADALAQISDPAERARLEQDIKGYQVGQQRQSWIDTTLGQSNIENSKVLDLKRDIEKEEENKRRFELGYDMQKEQLAQSRADSAYNRELNNKKLQLEMAKLNTKDLSAMEKDLATFKRIYGEEEGQNAFDKKYNPDGKTVSGKNELPSTVVDTVLKSQKSLYSGTSTEKNEAAKLIKGLQNIKTGLNLSNDSLENLSKVAIGESGWFTGAGNVNEKALESFFGKDTMVDQNGKVIPVGNAVKEILNNPDRFSIVNSGGKTQLIDLDTPTGKKLNELAFPVEKPVLPDEINMSSQADTKEKYFDSRNLKGYSDLKNEVANRIDRFDRGLGVYDELILKNRIKTENNLTGYEAQIALEDLRKSAVSDKLVEDRNRLNQERLNK